MTVDEVRNLENITPQAVRKRISEGKYPLARQVSSTSGAPGGVEWRIHITSLSPDARAEAVRRRAVPYDPVRAVTLVQKRRPIRQATTCTDAHKRLATMTPAEKQALFESQPAEKQAEARLREEIVRRWGIEHERKAEGAGMGFPEFADLMRTVHGIRFSSPTLSRWQRLYAAHRVYGLVDYRGRKTGQTYRLTGWARRFVEDVFFSEAGAVRPQHLWKVINAKAYLDGALPSYKGIAQPKPGGGSGQIVSRSAVARHLDALRERHADFIRCMNSPDRFDSHCEPAFGDASAAVSRPNQVWELDASPVDIMALRILPSGEARECRWHLISVVDAYSRLAVMLIAESSNVLSVTRALWKAVMLLGIPESVRVDNGKEYVGEQLLAGFRDLGCWVSVSRPFKGRDKAFVERAFRTIQHGMSENVAGYIGHNVADRAGIEGRTPKSERLQGRKTNQDELETLDMIRDRLDAWLCHVYPHELNRGLGKSPADAWRDADFSPRRISDDQFHYIFGERKAGAAVTNKGVRFRRITYQSPEMGKYTGRKVDLVIDINDVNRAYVFAPTGEFLCVARNGAFEPLTAEERKQAQRYYSARKREFRQMAAFARRNLGPDADRVAIIIEASAKEFDRQDIAAITGMMRSDEALPAVAAVVPNPVQAEAVAKLIDMDEKVRDDDARNAARGAAPDIEAMIRLKAMKQKDDAGKPAKKMTLEEMMGIRQAGNGD